MIKVEQSFKDSLTAKARGEEEARKGWRLKEGRRMERLQERKLKEAALNARAVVKEEGVKPRPGPRGRVA